MTTTDMIKLMQSDQALAKEAMSGMPSDKKYVFTRFYGISCDDSFGLGMVQRLSGLSLSRLHQLCGEAILWLRHPKRVRIFTAHLKEQQRQKNPFYQLWKQIVAHVPKNNKGHVQDQAKDVERN